MTSLVKISLASAISGVCLFSVGTQPLRAASLFPAAPAMYAQGPAWDEPPSELDEVSRKGFHDGVEGARKDFGNHRAPDPHNRDEFRHPHVPGRDREAYRRGFERGYHVGWDHISHER